MVFVTGQAVDGLVICDTAIEIVELPGEPVVLRVLIGLLLSVRVRMLSVYIRPIMASIGTRLLDNSTHFGGGPRLLSTDVL